MRLCRLSFSLSRQPISLSSVDPFASLFNASSALGIQRFSEAENNRRPRRRPVILSLSLPSYFLSSKRRCRFNYEHLLGHTIRYSLPSPSLLSPWFLQTVIWVPLFSSLSFTLLPPPLNFSFSLSDGFPSLLRRSWWVGFISLLLSSLSLSMSLIFNTYLSPFHLRSLTGSLLF